MIECWSYGGGVQSAAIAVLVAHGRLPRPAHVLIADTGREASSTWAYMKETIEPLLGQRVVVAEHSLSTVDLHSANGDLLIPAFTSGGGKLPTFCSTEWKKRVVHRKLRQLGVEACRLWVGISVDEVSRAKPSGVGWVEHRFPLLFDVPMRRSECLALVASAGLPEPPRSSCWCCPHRQNNEWRSLPAEEFSRAVELERELRKTDDGIYLHRSMVPLGEADLSESSQANLFGECDVHCWT